MDRFRTMESFVRVVRAGSFTIAASQLGLSRAGRLAVGTRDLGAALIDPFGKHAMYLVAQTDVRLMM